jgi:hypothetical protein
MTLTAKVLAYLSRSVVSVSTKLSAAAVFGVASLSLLLPHGAASWMSAPKAPIELVHARPVPLIEDAPGAPTFELVARRSRIKREAPAAEASRPSHKQSAISPPEPEKTPVPASGPKPEGAEAEPLKPDTWSEAQVIAALRECVKLLAPIAADIDIAEPVKREQCGAPAPVMLRRIGTGAGKVELSPPAMLNCAMVVGLHAWVEKTLQPAAQEAFGSPITRLRNASGYVCRNRVGGSAHNDDRLSEHALANAVDITGFVTADGRAVDVAQFWGPTARDEREAQRLAASRPKDAGPAADKGAPPRIERVTDRKISAIAPAAAEPARAKKGAAPVKTAEVQKSGKGASDAAADPRAIPATRTAGAEDVRKSVEAQFLRRLHKGACGVFGTVLGPEANEAHRDHFHFDLAPRRQSVLCQ